MKTLIVAVVWATANLVAAVGGSGYLLGAVSRRLALALLAIAAVASWERLPPLSIKGNPL